MHALEMETTTESIKKVPQQMLNGTFEGGAEWARTTDSRIFSPMLYQLSYSTLSERMQSYIILYIVQKKLLKL